MSGSAVVPQQALSDRAERLAALASERGVDALLVSDPVNVRWLTGFTGSNGLALLAGRDEGRHAFFTDFRYATQVAEQVPANFASTIESTDLLEGAARALSGLPGARVGFDDAHLSVRRHQRLAELLPEGWEAVACGGAVEELRAIKDSDEVRRIRAAAALVDEILAWLVDRGLEGRTERQVAVELEHEMRLRGAQGPSFSSIVAAGPHGSLPHAQPRDARIVPGCLVTIDLGAVLDGYCSDCTRTFAVGDPGEQAREIYELVLHAQREALDGVQPGRTGQQVDAIARDIIDAAGYADRFGHGLGHGVGLEVHEAPRLGRRESDAPLRPGNVVTVEPGIYLPGEMGVRIEDLVLVTEDGHEVLSHHPKDLLDAA